MARKLLADGIDPSENRKAQKSARADRAATPRRPQVGHPSGAPQSPEGGHSRIIAGASGLRVGRYQNRAGIGTPRRRGVRRAGAGLPGPDYRGWLRRAAPGGEVFGGEELDVDEVDEDEWRILGEAGAGIVAGRAVARVAAKFAGDFFGLDQGRGAAGKAGKQEGEEGEQGAGVDSHGFTSKTGLVCEVVK